LGVPNLIHMPKTQELCVLERQVKLLEKQKNFMGQYVENTDKKAIFFDLMIDMAENKFKIPIRKNF